MPGWLAAGAACLLRAVGLIQPATQSAHTLHSHMLLLTGCQLTHPPTYPPTLLCLQVRMTEGAMPPLVLVVAPSLTARNMLSDSPDVTALAKRVEPTRDRVGHWPGKHRAHLLQLQAAPKSQQPGVVTLQLRSYLPAPPALPALPALRAC